MMEDVGKLGFGLMRLPRKLAFTDVKQTSAMVDEFLEAGFNYFDTAYIYPGSEGAIRKALVSRYPRESYYLATKLNVLAAPTAAIARNQLATSLKRTGAGYIDYYLLHAIMQSNYQRYEKLGIWEFAAQQKREGVVKHVGFSFHADPELLDQLLTQHPETEFVQLQLNYADWENARVQSRANYEVARAHNVPIVVMEPVKGGKLANPVPEVRDLLQQANPHASCASWAIRFAASLEGVATVLSGMSTIEQMRDNLSYMRGFKPLDDSERAVIRAAQEALGRSVQIGCTGCGYCIEGCPQHIPIPQVLDAMNMRLEGRADESLSAYGKAVAGKGSASDCIACGACEKACTQGLPIIEHLQQAAADFQA